MVKGPTRAPPTPIPPCLGPSSSGAGGGGTTPRTAETPGLARGNCSFPLGQHKHEPVEAPRKTEIAHRDENHHRCLRPHSTQRLARTHMLRITKATVH